MTIIRMINSETIVINHMKVLILEMVMGTHIREEVVRHLQIATLKASHSYTYALILSYSFE